MIETGTRDALYGVMKITELDSFPQNENPFHHDAFHMGTPIGKTIMAMYANHNDNKYVIIVDIKTGERIKIEMNR